MQHESGAEAARVTDSRLGRTVQVNEEIKQVIRVSFQVNLMALNAILLARRAGGAAMGFRVLSTELREFIRELQATMLRLQEVTGEAVRGVTEDTRQGRVQGLLQRARSMTDPGAPAAATLQSVLRGRAEADVERRRDLARTMAALGSHVQDAARLGEFGAILARTAKIEAVYGGKFAPSLTQVAVDFDETIRDILESMQTLGRLHVSAEAAA